MGNWDGERLDVLDEGSIASGVFLPSEVCSDSGEGGSFSAEGSGFGVIRSTECASLPRLGIGAVLLADNAFLACVFSFALLF
jgi:hypothetical protein